MWPLEKWELWSVHQVGNYVTYGMHQNNKTNTYLKSNPSPLYIIIIFSLFRDKAEEVIEFENHEEKEKMEDTLVVEEDKTRVKMEE